MRRHLLPAAIRPPSPAPPPSISHFSPSALKTSAAFFNSLSTNLHLADAGDYDYALPSPVGTPSLRPRDFAKQPSPLAHAVPCSNFDTVTEHDLTSTSHEHVEPAPLDPLAGIPELTTFTAQSEDDELAGLKLVADSVAEQRSFAGKVLMFHPLNLALLAGLLVIATRMVYTDSRSLPRVFTVWTGIVMAYLIAVRLFSQPYAAHAEDVNWDWLARDRVLVTRFGQEIIGVLVLGWVAGDGRGSRRKRVGRGLIRAWTVKDRYRGKGVGTGLLEEAVQIVNVRGGDGLDFAEEHANSKRVLNPFYNTAFDRQEIRAQNALDDVAKQKGNFVKRGSR